MFLFLQQNNEFRFSKRYTEKKFVQGNSDRNVFNSDYIVDPAIGYLNFF